MGVFNICSWEFCQNLDFEEVVKLFSLHCLSIKSSNTAIYRSYTLRSCDPNVKFYLLKFEHVQKAKF